jgi:heme a synthase
MNRFLVFQACRRLQGGAFGSVRTVSGGVFRGALPRSNLPVGIVKSTVGGRVFQTNVGILRGTAYANSLRHARSTIRPKSSAGTAMAAAGGAVPSVSRAIPQDKLLASWILATGGMVFGMVTLGGATRLTRSGLSMVDWKPQGRPLPSTTEEWEFEFEKYKAFPEYQKLNQNMTLGEFKRIYFMEWAHRMWGRAIGLVFAVPLLGFAAAKRIPKQLYGRLALLFAMGGGQGLVGWWMVKSGLTHEHLPGISRSEHDTPRVSPYRLTAHLSMAFATYGVLMWTGMNLLTGPPRVKSGAFNLSVANSALKALRSRSKGGAALLGLTVLSGAFVAGNDAGHAYNDFPYMAGEIIPEQIWMDHLGLRNLFENTATVQFDHRVLAFTTLGTVGGLFLSARGNSLVWNSLNPDAKLALTSLVGVTTAQVGLGITTLMMYVPVELGVAHQGGALTLWTVALWLVHTLRYVK